MNDSVKVWWQSKIIWAQIFAVVFAVADTLGLKLSETLGVTQEGVLATVMTIVGVLTVVMRWGPSSEVVSTKTQAVSANRLRSGAALGLMMPPADGGSDNALDADSPTPAAEPMQTSELGGVPFSGGALREEAKRRPASPMSPRRPRK